MVKVEKVEKVADIAKRFEEANAAIVTEYRGLTMSSLTKLRTELGRDTTYLVAKNTLVKRAAANAGVEGADELFSGPTAVAFVNGDIVEAAKVIKGFAKENQALVVKGGYLDGAVLTEKEVIKLADLEGREVLLAKVAGAIKGALGSALGLLNAPLAQVARLSQALADQKQQAGE